jgi:CDP-6-deoxy-D-xylo-4-hexulose-3-dehydrase
LPYGYDHKFTYSEFGYNLKITDMQAAVGLAQIKKLPKFIEARIKNHEKLYKGLEFLSDKIILPKPQNKSKPSWFGFLITIKNRDKYDRTDIMRELEERKIQTRLFFAGNIVRQPVFNEMRNSRSGFKIIGDLENTDKVMNDAFWLGVYPGMKNEEIDYMITQIIDLLQ